MSRVRWRREMRHRVRAGGACWRVGSMSGSNGVPNADESLPPSGTTLRHAFDALVSLLNQRGIDYAIIGGLAGLQHGRIRTTDDIDALVDIPQLSMPSFFEALKERGFDLRSLNGFRNDHDRRRFA